MQKKILFSLVVLEGGGILGLLYMVWNLVQNSEEQLISNTYFALASIAVLTAFVVGLLQLKSDAQQVDIEVGRQHGLVKWFNPSKGFGFIEQDNGQDLFVHQSEIRLSGFRYLNKDDRVEYDIGLGKKGPVAQNVVRIKTADNEWDQIPEEEPISKAS